MRNDTNKWVPTGNPPGRPRKYTMLDNLAVGESAFLPGATSVNICSAARCRRPKRFTCRAVIKGGIEGVTVRRVE